MIRICEQCWRSVKPLICDNDQKWSDLNLIWDVVNSDVILSYSFNVNYVFQSLFVCWFYWNFRLERFSLSVLMLQISRIIATTIRSQCVSLPRYGRLEVSVSVKKQAWRVRRLVIEYRFQNLWCNVDCNFQEIIKT